MPEIFVCGRQFHHKAVVPCEPAWTVTAVLPVELFLPSSQRRHSYQLYVDSAIPVIGEEEEEGRAFGGGGTKNTTTKTTTTTTTNTKTTTTTMNKTTTSTMMNTTTTMATSTVSATNRGGRGGTHASRVCRTRRGSTGGCGGEGTNTNTIRFPRKTRLALSLLKKNVRNDDHDSKGLRR